MHGLAVYVKEELPFAWDLSLETLQIFTYVYDWLYFIHLLLSYFFFFYHSPSSTFRTVFDSISYSIDKVLSINPSANMFVFGDNDMTFVISTG